MHNSSTSLDILTLHHEIMNLKNAALLSFDTADEMRLVFPSWTGSKNGIYSLIMLALFVLGIILLLPFMLKLAFYNINM